MSDLFPEAVEAFLQGNGHPEAILPYLQKDDADSRMARLIGSGLIPSLLNVMLEGTGNQQTCRVLLHVAVHTDGPWQRFMVVRHFCRSLNATGYSHQDLDGLLFQLQDAPPVSASGLVPTPLLDLARLHMLVHAIRFLDKYKYEDETDIEEQNLIMNVTRLVARCLSQIEGGVDDEWLQWAAAVSIADPTQYKNAVVRAVRQEVSKKLLSTALVSDPDRWLEPVKAQDADLVEWIARSAGIYESLAGWIVGGAWKRSADIARTAPSWRKVRELLVLGARGSSGEIKGGGFIAASLTLANELRATPQEAKDGSFFTMPIKSVPPLSAHRDLLMTSGGGTGESSSTRSSGRNGSTGICSRPTCNNSAEKQCAGCKQMVYCSRDCQVRHWKDGHNNDCTRAFSDGKSRRHRSSSQSKSKA
eukprot:CAMPEP_0198287470 /NCGR_PEP_ID=MMETSP1449-20131203/6271_1 /TAXON_ID=420275 /ORGANISM="Attheya septentrionalis, Strain CCMP2084" /LENGTH=416 /DNA_ID=CAMNT_0043985429 /DNA_START=99 /DNA_END=1349 /DNA_ORIENTATION=-